MRLIASGPGDQKTRIDLVEGTVLRFGRAPKNGWAVPWDMQISREHADLHWVDGLLKVTCTANATNAIVHGGSSTREVVLRPGDSFRIGVTDFRLDATQSVQPAFHDGRLAASVSSQSAQATVDISAIGAMQDDTGEFGVSESSADSAGTAGSDFEEYSYGNDELKNVQFADPTRQMELLANLPRMITSSESDVELALKLVGLLLDAIPQAVAVAVVQYDEAIVTELRQSQSESIDLPKPKLMRVQTRDDYEGRFVPSRRLLSKALRLNESNLHIWAGGAVGGAQFTMSESLNWAFCTPITAESCMGWCLYVSGEGGRDGNPLITEDDLKGDLRFTELLAQFIGSIRQVRLLQEHKTQLSSFFSPKVIQSLTGRSAVDVLKPSERNISVMFCDVRGFSKKAEKYRDNLHELLNSVRAALSAMTGGILENDGTIADFQGDAALGFWGWPVTLEEGPIPACLAALAVQAEFNKPLEQQGLLEGFSVGVGIAHGRAIAGQIGTSQQAKVGVFGPVVNQGSRLEGMTKQFGVSICVDESTIDFVKKMLPPDKARVRQLARVKPKGMDTAITVGELLPPAGPASAITNEMIERHESAVEAIIKGDWNFAREVLQEAPAGGPKQFLIDRMAEFQNAPPPDWDGAFSLTSK